MWHNMIKQQRSDAAATALEPGRVSKPSNAGLFKLCSGGKQEWLWNGIVYFVVGCFSVDGYNLSKKVPGNTVNLLYKPKTVDLLYLAY